MTTHVIVDHFSSLEEYNSWYICGVGKILRDVDAIATDAAIPIESAVREGGVVSLRARRV